MSIKPQAARRRNSFVEIASNHLDGGGLEDEPKDHRIEMLASATLITQLEMDRIKDMMNNSR